MHDQEALFRAILAAPDDDAPRLIYADWLDENDQPERAEFIRVQVEQARLPWYERRHRELDARATALLGANFMAWILPHPLARQEFHRGFVERVSFDNRDDLDACPQDLDQWTSLRGIRIEPMLTHADAAHFASWSIREVDFQTFEVVRFRSVQEAAPRDWPALRTVQTTYIGYFVAFLRSVLCPQLADVRLYAAITDDVDVMSKFRIMLACLAKLRRLELIAPPPADFAARWHATHCRELFDSADLRKLEYLSFDGQAIGDAGLLAIVRHGALPHLAELHLEGNEIGATGTSGLEELLADKVPNLKVLSLAGNPLGFPGVRELAAWPGLRSLRYLNLVGCQIPDAGIRRLLESPYMHADLWLVHDADVS